jgi:hypothetical protein
MKRPGISNLALSIFQALFVYAVLAPTGAAWAQTIGDSITGGMTGVATMPVLINYIAYIAGFVVAVTGLLKVKDHVVAPDRTPLSHGLWRLGAAGLLISLPVAAGLLMRTILTNNVFGTTTAATTVPMAMAASPSLDQMMINLITNIKAPMGFLIWSLSAILGLFFLVSAFVRMAKGAGQDGPRGSLGSGTVGRVIIGAILLSLAATADIFTTTIFGGAGAQFSGMNIPGVAAPTLARAESVMAAILVFIQIIGFIAFMRGFLMLRALADGNNGVSTAAAATHIVGGAVAINISPALEIIQTTVCGGGCSVLSF